jgi:hypothetical protein
MANFDPVLSRYYILTPEKRVSGMFSNTLYLQNVTVDLEG